MIHFEVNADNIPEGINKFTLITLIDVRPNLDYDILIIQNLMGEVLEYQISNDVNGNHLSGSNNYRLHLQTSVPLCKFWSVIVYDQADNLMIRTDQPWPSIHSNLSRLVVNEDGSTDIIFGPKAPLNRENNWIRTLPGKKWYAIIRLYDPLEAFHDISWKPDDIVELDK